jgi:pyruvate dehydrogenase E2 component (dihydrolipoamide acetyltransferase)
VYEFKLPDLGEGIQEGEILKWHINEGDAIAEDAPLVDVETDKAAVTIPSPKAGRIAKLNGKAGDVIAVGEVIAVIAAEGEAAPAAAEPKKPAAKEAAPAPKAPAAPPVEAAPAAAVPAARPSGRPVPAAPATRRLAREMKIDIALVPASGPGGRVTPEDLERFARGEAPAAAAPAEPTPAVETRAEAQYAAHAATAIPFLDLEPLPEFEQWGPVEREPLRSIRRKVAHKMVTSMVLVPHVAHMDEADVTELEAFRKAERERREGQPGSKLTLLAFMIKAVSAGLKQTPAFNASLDPFREEIVYKKYINIGIAVDTGRGLVVPVVRGTACKSITEIATDIETLAGKAREGSLGVDDMRGGTFTITNVGPLGGTALIPTINYPEVAILGMGRVQEKPVVRDGEIVIRKILPLTLAFDHRIADGADAARFVSEMVRQLSNPNLLLLEA